VNKSNTLPVGRSGAKVHAALVRVSPAQVEHVSSLVVCDRECACRTRCTCDLPGPLQATGLLRII
jgi:hypothetical protein